MEQWLPFIVFALAMASALWALVRVLDVPGWIVVAIAFLWPAPFAWHTYKQISDPPPFPGPGQGMEWIFIIPFWVICLVATIVLVVFFGKKAG